MHKYLSCSFFLMLMCVLASCANVPAPHLQPPTYNLAVDKQSFLAQQSRIFLDRGTHNTGAYPLNIGDEALLARLALIDKAQTSIDLQVYLFHKDSTGSTLAHHLYKAAERGVRVRILLDDNEKRDDAFIASVANHANIDIRLFNAKGYRSFRALSLIVDFKRSNRRMHNKSMIADSSFAIIGGRNIGDEYFAASGSTNFADYDLLLLGDVVYDAAQVFDLFWNSPQVTPITQLVKDVKLTHKEIITNWTTAEKKLIDSGYYQSLLSSKFFTELENGKLSFYWGEAWLRSDHPSKGAGEASGDDLLKTWIGRHLATAKKDLLLISPYFVPTNHGTEYLVNAAARGIDITVITNSLASNDVFAVHGKYARQRKKLLKGKVKLYELKANPEIDIKRSSLGASNSSLHAKTWVIDGESVFVGSFNFDPRSANLNTEMGVVMLNSELANDMKTEILENLLSKYAYSVELDDNGKLTWMDLANGKQFDREPHASIWLRLGAWFVGLLPVESNL